jgi:hypothetical protein
MITKSQVKARVSADLRDRLRVAAESAGRTLNAEMVIRLERSLLGDELRAIIREELGQKSPTFRAWHY